MLHPTRPARPENTTLDTHGALRRPRSRGTAARVTKAGHATDCGHLEQLPNIGPALAADLRLIGIDTPRQLVGQDAFELYQHLARATGRRPDPCVLDTFLAIVDFMQGAAPAPWWRYTAERKLRFGNL